MTKCLLQRSFNLRNGDCAFADNLPRVSVQFHNRRRQRRPCLAAVEDQGQPVAQLLHHLLRIRTRRKTRDVRACPRDRPVKFRDEPPHDLAPWPANCNPSRICSDLERQPGRSFCHQRQCARPEFLRKPHKILRRLAREQHRLLQRIHKDGQCSGLRPAFHPVNLIHGREVKWIGRQAVQRIRGNPNDTPARKEMRRIAQHISFGGLCVDAQQFSRQFFRPWRSRRPIPQRSARAALIWARYHTPVCGAITASNTSVWRLVPGERKLFINPAR
jgi:hypothetical protein